MKEVIWIGPQAGVRIRHVGILDLDEFYKWAQRYLDFYGFFSNKPYFEEYYIETNTPAGKTIDIKWIGKKKINNYYTYVIEVVWLLVAVNPVETTNKEGKKVKLKKGDFDIKLFVYIERDTKGNKLLRDLYEKFIIRQRTLDHRLKLRDRMEKFSKEIKEYFRQYV